MSRLEEIMKKLNSVGLSTNDDLRDALMEYFCEDDADNNNDTDDDDTNREDDAIPVPLSLTVIPQINSDFTRPVFWYGSCSDDTGTSHTMDKGEDKLISDFMDKTCCHLKCTEHFTKETVLHSRINAQELNHFSQTEHVNFLHVSILGGLNCCVAVGEETNYAKNKNHKRNRARGHFCFQGQPICKEFYLFLHGVSDKVYRRLKDMLTTDGIVPRPHQNTTKTSLVRAHPVEVRQTAVKFLENFAIQNAVVLPGRVPGFKNPDLLLLPSEFTKKAIHEKYVDACLDGNTESIPYSTFTELWREQLPGVCIQKPRSDLCTVCKLDTIALSKLRTLNDEKRRELLDRNIRHLNHVDNERHYYKDNIDIARKSVNSSFSIRPSLGINKPCTFSGTNHYSFDYFQQVHVPYDPDQVGALYFLTPYKVGLFGIMCEPLAKMALFIIPEGAATGKGSNQVISMLHFYLENLGLGETEVILNADNCVGQNKNQFMMSYLCWRVLSGLHKKITLHFLVVGHTKFSPDYAGGVFKKMFRRTPCSTPTDVAECAKKSSILHPVVTGSIDGKQQYVPMFDWQSKLAKFRSIPGMKKFHVFQFASDNPGVVVCKEYCDSAPISFTLVASNYSDSNLPPVLPSLGLSQKRQSYLHEKIRLFVPDQRKDELCPAPDLEPESIADEVHQVLELPASDMTVEQAADVATDVPTTSDNQPKRLATPKRKAPKCSNCGEIGHRNLAS